MGYRATLPMMGLITLATAYSGFNGSVIVGNGAPYQIPQETFQQAISQANGTGQVTVPGFNLSANNVNETQDWTIQLSVAGNVPLEMLSFTEHDADEGMVTDLTSMSMDAPSPMDVVNETPNWKMCTTLAFGLSSKATQSGQDDMQNGGKCEFMSVDCRNALEEAARNASATCGGINIPESCSQWFQEAPIKTQSFEMTKQILGNNRFFSFGSPPTQADNDTAYDQAITNIWPIIVSYNYQSNSNNANNHNDTFAALRCMRASQIAYQSQKPENVPSQDPNPIAGSNYTNSNGSGSGNGNGNGNGTSANVTGDGSSGSNGTAGGKSGGKSGAGSLMPTVTSVFAAGLLALAALL